MNSQSQKRFRDLVVTGAILPVNLTKFNATPNNGTVALEWATAREQNNRHFSVQRSGDGRTFTEIGEVRGTGNSVTAQNYAYLDRAPLSGMNYYRLEQVDFDGATAIYGPLAVNMRQTAGTKPEVYPNPATNFINISSEMDDDTQVTLVSITGQVISTMQFGLTKTGNVGNLDISQLKSGVYFLRFENGNDLETVRFVKE